MKKMKRLLSLLLCCILVLSLTGCGGSDASSNAGGGDAANSGAEANGGAETNDVVDSEVSTSGGEKNLIYSMNRDISNISPTGNRSAAMFHVLPILYDFLYCAPIYGASADELVPDIAKSYEMVDDLTCQVTLYDYVTDSEGNAITAEDIVFSYDLLTSQGAGANLASVYESGEVVDDYTVNLHMKSNYVGDLEMILTGAPIVDKEWFEAAPESESNLSPVATGPYKVVEAVPGSHIQLTKNENYWQTDASLVCPDGRQPFDNIRFNIILESSMAVIGLQNGEADIARDIPVTSLDQFPEDQWNYFNNVGGMTYYLMYNNAKGVFAGNKELRHAISYAVDADALLKAFASVSGNVESGGVCKTFGNPAFGGYQDKWDSEEYFEYDPEKAKELLAEAGYPDGLTLTVMYDSTAAKEAAMTVLKIQLAEVGVNAELVPLENAAISDNQTNPDSGWDIFCCQLTSGSPFMSSFWKYVLHPNNWPYGSMPFAQDDTMTELLEAAANVDTASDETIDAFHQYLKEQDYIYGIYWCYEYFISRKGITVAQDGFGNCSPTRFTVDDDYVSVSG